VSRESQLINSMQPKLCNIASNMILPNTSGDHVRSIKRDAPVAGVDLVNKTYADGVGSGIVATYLADHPHQNVNTTASPSFVNITGTLQTAAQPNITSVGTLASLSVTGLISGGSLKATDLTAGRIPIVGAAGLLINDSQFKYNVATGLCNIQNFTLFDTLTHVSGTMDFGNNILTTTGEIRASNGVNCLYMNSGYLRDTSGAISFGNENLSTTGTLAAAHTTIDVTMLLQSGSITDSSGAISFDNENLSTTGTLGCGQLTPGNIIIANGGTIGQAAGPLLNFDDTNNYLEITGCNVGIGTSSPSGPLHIYSNHSTGYAGDLIVQNPSDSTEAGTILRVVESMGGGVNDKGSYIIYWGSNWAGTGAQLNSSLVLIAAGGAVNGLVLAAAASSAPIKFFTSGLGESNERMRIDGSGNVGIGMTPVKTLDVNGSIKGTNYYSGDGTQGIDTTITTANLVGKTITVKDGLIVGFA